MAAASVIDKLDSLFIQSDGGGGGRKAAPEPRLPPQVQRSAAAAAAATQPTHAQEMCDLDRFIDGEIRQRLSAPNMTWRKLDACFKWRALQDYLRSLGVREGDPAYARARELLRGGKLAAGVVEYDACAARITRVAHDDLSLPPPEMV